MKRSSLIVFFTLFSAVTYGKEFPEQVRGEKTEKTQVNSKRDWTFIYKPSDLELIRQAPKGAKFRMARDLDMTGINFKPIYYFHGTLDGNGHSISNLTLNPSTGSCKEVPWVICDDEQVYNITDEWIFVRHKGMGLFRVLDKAKVVNLTITNFNIDNEIPKGYESSSTGGLAGVCNACTISRINLRDKIRPSISGGGLFGAVFDSEIEKVKGRVLFDKADFNTYDILKLGGVAGYSERTSFKEIDISVSANLPALSIDWTMVGGIVGMENGGSSYYRTNATVSLSSPSSAVGGLIGESFGTVEISEASVAGRMIGKLVGGLIGDTYESEVLVSKSYTNTDLVSHLLGGGLVGFQTDGVVVFDQVYSNGTIRFPTFSNKDLVKAYYGGRILSRWVDYYSQHSSAIVTQSYSHVTLIGLTTPETKVGESPISAQELASSATFVGWDFNNVWKMSQYGYPVLRK